MPQPTNTDRAADAAATLSAYRSQTRGEMLDVGDTGLDQALLLRDLLADLMHYADATASDFDLLLDSANRTYRRQAQHDLPEQADEANPFAATDQEVIGLLAEDVAHAVRDLTSSITRTGSNPGLTSPQAAHRLLDGLGQAARHLANAFPQIAEYVQREHAAGRLADVHDDPEQAVGLATLYLKVAQGTASSLAGAVRRSEQAITGMKAAAPAVGLEQFQPSPAELARQDFPSPNPDLSTPVNAPQEPGSTAAAQPKNRNIPRM